MQRYGPLKPYDWPQDNLAIPNGQGLMPIVEKQNAFNTRREGTVFSTVIDIPAGLSKQEIIIPTPADGDFWCDTILLLTAANSFPFSNTSLNYKMNIMDLRTGIDLTFPYARAYLFEPSEVLPGNDPFARVRGTFEQPFCFTRNGGIRLIIEMDRPADQEYTSYISFVGWKEYTYASR